MKSIRLLSSVIIIIISILLSTEVIAKSLNDYNIQTYKNINKLFYQNGARKLKNDFIRTMERDQEYVDYEIIKRVLYNRPQLELL